MPTSAAQRAVRELAPAVDRIGGTLRMYGQWFGKPYDNWHAATSVSAEGDALTVTFAGGEDLTVVDPEGWALAPSGLVIARARRVRWRWYYYGRPPTEANRFTIDHHVDGRRLRSESDADWFEPRGAKVEAPAVELLVGW